MTCSSASRASVAPPPNGARTIARTRGWRTAACGWKKLRVSVDVPTSPPVSTTSIAPISSSAAEREDAGAAAEAQRRREREEEQARRLRDAEALAAANRRRAQAISVGLAVALALAIVAAWFGYSAHQQKLAAEKATNIAEQQTQIAKQQTVEAKNQKDAATRAAQEAETQRAAATAAREAGLIAEARRIAALSQQFANANRPNLAAAVALSAAPIDAADERPLTPPLEAALRRSVNLARLPIERFLGDKAFSLALSPDGKMLAAGTVKTDTGGWVFVFNSTTLRELFRFKAGDDVVSALDFSPDGDRLLAGGDKIPVVWSVSRRVKLFDLGRPNVKQFAKSATFSPDGKLILVGTSENRALIHDGTTGKLLFELPGSSYEESRARLKASGDELFGVADPIVAAVAQANFRIFGSATDAVFSPDGKLAAVSGQADPDASVRLYDTSNGKLVRILREVVEARLARR